MRIASPLFPLKYFPDEIKQQLQKQEFRMDVPAGPGELGHFFYISKYIHLNLYPKNYNFHQVIFNYRKMHLLGFVVQCVLIR